MKSKTRKSLVVAAAAGLALTLTACSSSSTGGTTGGSDAAEITFFAYKNEQTMGPLIAAFEKANPGIKVKATYNVGAGPEYATTLQTRIAGGQAPDVFQIVSENRSDVLANKLAVDLSDLTALKAVNPAFLSLYTEDGKTYGVSYTAWMGGLIYNKDLLKQAGYDAMPTKWDDFVTMGEAMLKKNIVPYYEEQGIPSGSLTALLASSFDGAGKAPTEWAVDAHPKGSTFAQSWTPVVTAWNKAVSSGVMPADTIGLKQDAIKAAFISGGVAMYRSGTWDGKDLNASGVNYGFAPFPGYGSGPTYINGGAEPPYAVSSKADDAHMTSAKKFVDFLGSAEGVKVYADSQGAMSISTAYATDAGPAFTDAYKNNLIAGKAYWFEWSKNPKGMTDALALQQQLLFQKNGTPESFTAAMDEQYKK